MVPDNNITDWFAIVISLAALLWTAWESRSTRRELRRQAERAQENAERSEYRELLDNCLLAFEATLGRSKVAFQSLASGPDGVRQLEYSPASLRVHFDALPDSRRIFWHIAVKDIHAHNEQSIKLIDDFASRSRLSADFLAACEGFRRHARTWKIMWDAATDGSINADKLPSDRITEPFPVGFDDAVAREVDRVKQAAGL